MAGSSVDLSDRKTAVKIFLSVNIGCPIKVRLAHKIELNSGSSVNKKREMRNPKDRRVHAGQLGSNICLLCKQQRHNRLNLQREVMSHD